MSTAILPAWLENTQTPGYLDEVTQLLAGRERSRESARLASVHRDHPSRTHRVLHLPETAFKDDSLTTHYSVSCAYTPDNLRANRYVDVAPYNRTRVVVNYQDGEPSAAGRYLNASWVRELVGGKWWIATQAPLRDHRRDTTHAFLSLLLQSAVQPPPDIHPLPPATAQMSRVRTVVQLTLHLEDNSRKADHYFPDTVGDSWISKPEPGYVAQPIKITLVDVKHIPEAHCVQSTVSVQFLSAENLDASVGDPVVFQHMLFKSWPDHAIPADMEALLRFVRLVDDVNRDVSSQPEALRDRLDPDPPIIVGCSAGIGRTGTFIALSSLLRKYQFIGPSSPTGSPQAPPLTSSPLGDIPENYRDDLVVQEVDSLREQRPGMVQRPSQLKLIYECVMQMFAERASHNYVTPSTA